MAIDTSKIGNEKIALQAQRMEKLFEQVADYSNRLAKLEAYVEKLEGKKAAGKTAAISKDEVSE